nr:MAG TPA: hypothetical protein [Caudoviricetes sp.]
MIKWERIAQINIPWFGLASDTGSCNCWCPLFLCLFCGNGLVTVRMHLHPFGYG